MKKTLALLLLLAGLNLGAWGETLTWNGSEGHMTWNFEDDNWLLDETAAKYTDGADVVFGNTGCGRVTLVDSFAPKSVLVENTPGHTYFFNGNGNLTGAMQLTKDGEDVLFIYTANDYTGGTVIKGGTLQMVNENALGSEDVTLMGGTLNLGEHTLSNNVNVNGSGHIANGTVSGKLSLADNASFTWEEGSFLELTGSITLGNNTTLDLGKHTLSQNVILNGAETSIGNGSINNDLTVAGQKLTLAGYVDGTGNIILGDGARLVLNDYTLSNKVVLKGSAVISGGTLDSDLTVGANKRLSLDNNLTGKGNIILADHSELFLFHSTLSNNVILNGNDAAIDASVGTLSGDLILADNASFTWANCESLQFTGSVTLGNEASLNLGGNTLSNNVNVTGSRAYIGGGSFSGELTVGTNKELSLCGDLSGNGTIILGESATLDLGKHTLSQNVILNGYETSIGNGSINTDLAVTWQKLTLAGYVDGTGNIILGDGARLVLNDYTLSNNVVLKGPAVIGGGTLDSELTVGENQNLRIDGNLKGTGNIILADHSELFLNYSTLSKSVSLNGGAHIHGNGTISGDLILADNTSFLWSRVFLNNGVQLTGNIALGERTDLDLEGRTLSNNVNVNGTAHITNGTVSGNLNLADNVSFTWSDEANLQLTGSISLGNNTTFDLGGHILSNSVILNGTAHIANGTVSGNLNLADGASFTWSDEANLQLTGSISLGTGAELDLGKRAISNDIILNGGYACIGNGSINKDLDVNEKQTLCLRGDIDGTGNIILGQGARLKLNGYTLSNSVTLNGNASVGGGTLDNDLTVGEYQNLRIDDNLKGTGNIILADHSDLFLLYSTLSKSVSLNGGAHILGYGTISGDLILADNTSFFWSSVFRNNGVQLTGNIALGERTDLDLEGQILSASVNVIGDNASIQGGNLAGDLTLGAGNWLNLHDVDITGTGVISLEDGAQLHWRGQTLSGSIKLGRRSGIRAWLGSSTTDIQAIQARGLLEKVSVSDGLIAGTDRQASLADGLYIESDANLMIKSMTLTANNKISVGEHTITLNQVTIDLSQAKYELVGTDYYFQLQDLINCTLEMDDVVFDASGLELPTGFDPGVNGIGIDFGDDVTIDPQTAKNLTLLMGGDWSQTMSLDQQGRPVFTALVPTPEPTTGTLSLLELAALAARRRKDN